MNKTLLSSSILLLFAFNSLTVMAESQTDPAITNTAPETTPASILNVNTANTAANTAANIAPAVSNNTITWLGVSLTSIDSDLAHHLGSLLNKGQGVMVGSVAIDSPAAKAGIKAYDILLAFDQQKLFSAYQLTQLVRASKPQQTINIKLIREGQIKTIDVVLDHHQMQADQLGDIQPRMHTPDANWFMWQQMQDWARNQHNLGLRNNFPNQQFMHKPLDNKQQSWSEFESMQMRSIGKDKFHAELETKSSDGNNKKFIFEGTKEELNKQIQENKEISQRNKTVLLNALSLRKHSPFENGFPFNHRFGSFSEFPDY